MTRKKISTLLFVTCLLISFPAFAEKSAQEIRQEVSQYEKMLKDMEPGLKKAKSTLTQLMFQKEELDNHHSSHSPLARKINRAIDTHLLQVREMTLIADSLRGIVNDRLSVLNRIDQKKNQSNRESCANKKQDETLPLKTRVLDTLGKLVGYRLSSRFESTEPLCPEKEALYSDMLRDLEAMKGDIDVVAPERTLAKKFRAWVLCTGRTKVDYIRDQIQGFRSQDLYLESVELDKGIKLQNKSGFMSHPQKNTEEMEQDMLKTSPALIRSEYLRAKNDGKVLDFFKNGFDHGLTCLEGRTSTLLDNAARNIIDEDLTIQYNPQATDEELLYEHLRVFKNKRIREFLQTDKDLSKEYDAKYKGHENGEDWIHFKARAEAHPNFALTQKSFADAIQEANLVGKKSVAAGESAPTPMTDERLKTALKDFLSANDYYFTE